MLRFFTSTLSFGAESIAVNILYLMKDLHRDSLKPLQLKYAYHGKYDSDNIANKSMLVSKLSKIILDTIDYDQYKNLTSTDKTNISMAIARQLYLESKNYKSSYIDSDAYWYGQYGCHPSKTKGISFSCRLVNDPYDEAYQVNFPEKLFSNQPVVKNCLRIALEEQYSYILLKKENPSFNLTYDLHDL